jgi:outer membrane protein OmpA-like peptidoglycan-associated protein
VANREVTPTALVPQMPETLVFEARRTSGGATTLAGAVPADATAAYFAVLAGNEKADGLTAKADLPQDFIPSGTAGLNALAELSEGRLGFDGTRWWLEGKAEQQSVRDDVLGKIAALPNGKDWSVNVDLLASIDVCRIRVGALAGRNAIVFQAGKAALMASSMPVLDELANDLQLCADTDVHVQGHTDADGDADANLALSVARAETVVAELVKRGVAESRLYAEGFGESDPVASNDTKDGKAKNRRIAFEISKE